jgi:hypothetical protein
MIKEQLKLDAEMRKRNCPFCPFYIICQYTHATVLFSHACSDDDDDYDDDNDDYGNDDLLSFQFFIYSRDDVKAYLSIKS